MLQSKSNPKNVKKKKKKAIGWMMVMMIITEKYKVTWMIVDF